jgi:hypothetical protein
MLSDSFEVDWQQSEPNSHNSSFKMQSIPGTVCVSNDQDSPAIGPLNDLFHDRKASALTQLFINPKGIDSHLKSSLLFGAQHDTFTKGRLSDILATLDMEENDGQAFAWPVGTKSSAESSTPSLRKDNVIYPNDIDFLEDNALLEDDQKVEQTQQDDFDLDDDLERVDLNQPLQKFRMPKSNPVSNSEKMSLHELAKEDERLTNSISNVQNPFESTFAEENKFSSIQETSIIGSSICPIPPKSSAISTPISKDVENSNFVTPHSINSNPKHLSLPSGRTYLDLSHRDLDSIPGDLTPSGNELKKLKL